MGNGVCRDQCSAASPVNVRDLFYRSIATLWSLRHFDLKFKRSFSMGCKEQRSHARDAFTIKKEEESDTRILAEHYYYYTRGLEQSLVDEKTLQGDNLAWTAGNGK